MDHFPEVIRRHSRASGNRLFRALWLVVAVGTACSDSGTTPTQTFTINKLAGDGQTANVAAMVAVAPTVTVLGADGQASAGTQVIFTITAGGGATSDTTVLTNAAGVAATEWYLGPGAQQQNKLRVSVGNITTEFTATSTAGTVGASYFGRNSYMEYIPGDLPIVISAPHGGTLTPGEIPDRTYGTTGRDLNTQELIRQISDAIFAKTQHRPHIIICRLARIKLDANREIIEAAQGDPIAQRAWYEYHAFIRAAKSKVNGSSPRGLYMDLHGHGHAIPRLELGYLLTGSELRLSDVTLQAALYVNLTSIRALVASSGSTLPQLIRGPFSLGALFELEGYPSVPSASTPAPLQNEDYFSGGYNTEQHGSLFSGNISGFQLEANFTNVRDTQQNRATFATAIADVLEEYLNRFFNIDITP